MDPRHMTQGPLLIERDGKLQEFLADDCRMTLLDSRGWLLASCEKTAPVVVVDLNTGTLAWRSDHPVLVLQEPLPAAPPSLPPPVSLTPTAIPAEAGLQVPQGDPPEIPLDPR